jgi:hypothetical protein
MAEKTTYEYEEGSLHLAYDEGNAEAMISVTFRATDDGLYCSIYTKDDVRSLHPAFDGAPDLIAATFAEQPTLISKSDFSIDLLWSIKFGSSSFIYTLKVGRAVLMSATYEDASDELDSLRDEVTALKHELAEVNAKMSNLMLYLVTGHGPLGKSIFTEAEFDRAKYVIPLLGDLGSITIIGMMNDYVRSNRWREYFDFFMAYGLRVDQMMFSPSEHLFTHMFKLYDTLHHRVAMYLVECIKDINAPLHYKSLLQLIIEAPMRTSITHPDELRLLNDLREHVIELGAKDQTSA